MENNLNTAHTDGIKGYIHGIIADAVQQDKVLEAQTLTEENKAIEAFMKSIVLDSEVKEKAANALAEVLADNMLRLKQLAQDGVPETTPEVKETSEESTLKLHL